MINVPQYNTTEKIYESENSMVYRANRIVDQEPVILKILRKEYPTPHEIFRFQREFDIIKKFNDPGIIKIYNLEKYKNTRMLVLEDFGGTSLMNLLSKKKFSIELFLKIAIQVSRILVKVHGNHVIHKDINPANILWNSKTEKAQIIDFGISTELSRETPSILTPEVLEGTIAYMSPEQTGRMNRAMDYRTDFYSLGATFYYMLTEQRPFLYTDPMELVHAHITKFPTPPHQLREDVPEILSTIITKLMSKTMEHRYQTLFGLIHDLEQCLNQLQSTGKIVSFEIAQKDISNIFQISQTLYGREPEIEMLLSTFDRVADGNKEMMMVLGYSGIGKSSIIQEIHKPIVKRRGAFISGKFDQLKRNIPYASLIQAFQNLIQNILTLTDEQILKWKNKLLKALGENGQIIIEVIPEIEQILGKQPPVPILSPRESQNRFHYTLLNFIQTFASEDHILVLFLDDLQWADLSSLNLIKQIMMNSEIKYLFLIGAYRNNEVDEAHPLMLLLGDLKKSNVTIHNMILEPLKIDSINQLVSNTLKCDLEKSLPLAKLCLEKTQGNPFFLNQFLQLMYDNSWIQFNNNQGIWNWEIEKIKNAKTTDNIVDLMVGKLQKLPEQTQNSLKLAACIGNQFDLETLSVILGCPPTQTLENLWQAIADGLVIPRDNNYQWIQNIKNTPEPFDSAQTPNSLFSFLHDRVQQAAYSFITEDQKKEVHLKIGRLLLQNVLNDHSLDQLFEETQLFDIVHHLNLGSSLIQENFEKEQVARLNLFAGKKATDSASYSTAINYLYSAIKLLKEDAWQTQYKLKLELHIQIATAFYMNADFEQMHQWSEEVFLNAQSLLEKVKIYKVRIDGLIAQNKLLEGVYTGLEVLKLLKVELPDKPKKLNIILGLLETKWYLKGKKPEDLINLPKMENPHALAAMEMLSGIGSPSYFALPNLLPLIAFKELNLTIQFGNTAISTVAYAVYGFILCGVLGDIETGYRFGQLSLKLLDQLNAKELRAKVLFLVNSFIIHWKEHPNKTLSPLIDSYQYGLEMGDLEYTANAIFSYLYHSYFVGNLLPLINIEVGKFTQVLEQIKQKFALHRIQVFHQTLANLMELQENPSDLVGSYYDENKMLPQHLEAKDYSTILTLYFNKFILAYFFEDYPKALEYSLKAKQYLDSGVASLHSSVYYFYDSLNRLAFLSKASSSEKKSLLKTINQNRKKIKNWTEKNPENYSNKFHLVEAEYQRTLGNAQDAITHYKQAIQFARDNEFHQEEALANELYGKFWLEQNEPEISNIYLAKAHHQYQLWGANAKTKHIETMYPNFIVHQKSDGLTVHRTTTSTTGDYSGVLDLSSIMKAAQTISGEIQLDQLLKKLIAIVLENAGAEKGSLLLEKKGKWYIEAQGDIHQKDISVLTSIPLDGKNSPSLPIAQSIIRLVARTLQSIVINDASKENRFLEDESYILNNQVKSVLCSPLLNQGKLVGILYLENNLTIGAFTKNRLEVLEMLTAQISVSIENAKLYNTMSELNHAYERFVPKEFLSLLKKEDIIEVKLGDQVEREMTVLFSDIRDFTNLSEQMSPQENFNFINSYLSRMEPVIHEQHGFIDKFIGDAIMALFPTSADNAVRGSIGMLQELKTYNQHRIKQGFIPISIGIGINTGNLMLGTVGGHQRMEGTVISDTVNLSSRIEGLTKQYGSSLLIGEDSYHSLQSPEAFHIRFVDRVRVKGKKHPVSLYEVFDADPAELKEQKILTRPKLEQAYQFYLNREFTKALQLLEECFQKSPDDFLIQVYKQRCLNFQKNPPDSTWDGLTSFLTK